jgi:hypothetical protein
LTAGRYPKDRFDWMKHPDAIQVECPKCSQEIHSMPDEWMWCCCLWTAIEGGRVWFGMQVVES